MHAYRIEMFWSDEDNGFIAVAPDLPGCSAFAETRTDCAREIEDAMWAWVHAATKAGNPVPEPSARSAGAELDREAPSTPENSHG